MIKEPKIGDEYFHLFIDESTGEHEWWIYRVRSVQNRVTKSMFPDLIPDHVTRYVYAIQINEFTWGKRSKKHGDFGWLDPISSVWRDKWKVGTKPHGLFLTKKQALKAEMAEYDARNYDSPEIADKVLKKLKRMIKTS